MIRLLSLTAEQLAALPAVRRGLRCSGHPLTAPQNEQQQAMMLRQQAMQQLLGGHNP